MKSSKLALKSERIPAVKKEQGKALVPPIITLTTDFGLQDYFVSALKGVLLQKAPKARIVDISHQVPRHDTISAAFIIKESFPYFPRGSTHLVVVDPGVGSTRREIVVNYQGHFFIGPDNGVFSYLLKKKQSRVYEITRTKMFIAEKSPTFAGRDHFAPVTAAIALGKPSSEFGPEIGDAKIIAELFCKKNADRIQGRIIYIDAFGNAITNLTRANLGAKLKNLSLEICGKKTLQRLVTSYSKGKSSEGNLILNSSGHLEIFSPHGNVKRLLKLKLLDEVVAN